MKRALLLVAVVSLSACAGNDDGPTADDGPLANLRRMGEAAEEMQQRQEDGQAAAEPVDFRRLRELLPETVAGLPRTNAEGAREGFGGMNVSHAEGTYDGPAGTDGAAPHVELKVTDMSGAGMAAMLGAAWTMASVDRESDRDYERTVRIDGNPGYEKYDTVDRTGDFQVMIADRFLVQASGRGVTDDQLREALRAVSFRALEGMRDEGR